MSQYHHLSAMNNANLYVVVFLSVVSSSVSGGSESNCPQGPIITSNAYGRLGNSVFDYAGVCAVAEIFPGNYQPYMREHQRPYIEDLFEEPYLPVLEDIPSSCSCCVGTDWTKENMGDVTVRELMEWNKTENIIFHSPSVLNQPILHKLEFLRSRLKYKKKLIEAAKSVINDVTSQFPRKNNLTFVGVHVRRTDYLQDLPAEKQVGTAFFNFAFDYFRNRKELGNCVFLVVSDDPSWVKNQLISSKTDDDVLLVNNGLDDPGYDLALLSSCDHVIFDYGSFGLWGALYAGGEVLTTSSYGKAYPFIRRTNFHFFDPVPKEELTILGGYVKGF